MGVDGGWSHGLQVTIETVARSKARLLLVEDHPAVSRAIVRLVRDCASVHPVNTIAAAELRRRDAWDGMIVDHGLPDGSGLEFARRVRAEQPHVELLIFTAGADERVADGATASAIWFANKTEDNALVLRFAAAKQYEVGGVSLLVALFVTLVLPEPKRKFPVSSAANAGS